MLIIFLSITGHEGPGHHRDARQRPEAGEASGLPGLPVCPHAQVLAEEVSDRGFN